MLPSENDYQSQCCGKKKSVKKLSGLTLLSDLFIADGSTSLVIIVGGVSSNSLRPNGDNARKTNHVI